MTGEMKECEHNSLRDTDGYSEVINYVIYRVLEEGVFRLCISPDLDFSLSNPRFVQFSHYLRHDEYLRSKVSEILSSHFIVFKLNSVGIHRGVIFKYHKPIDALLQQINFNPLEILTNPKHLDYKTLREFLEPPSTPTYVDLVKKGFNNRPKITRPTNGTK